MEKIKFLVVIIFLTINSYGQENTIDTGLISTQLTLSPSALLKQKESNFYLHGSLSYYISPKISLDGEGYYQLGAISSDEKTFKYNHNLFFGASKHVTANDNDFYVGIQPGVAFSKLNPKNSLTTTHAGINPVASVVTGYNFYVNSFMHFFFQARYIAGRHNYDVAEPLSEIRFSAGLGFNLSTKKNKE